MFRDRRGFGAPAPETRISALCSLPLFAFGLIGLGLVFDLFGVDAVNHHERLLGDGDLHAYCLGWLPEYRARRVLRLHLRQEPNAGPPLLVGLAGEPSFHCIGDPLRRLRVALVVQLDHSVAGTKDRLMLRPVVVHVGELVVTGHPWMIHELRPRVIHPRAGPRARRDERGNLRRIPRADAIPEPRAVRGPARPTSPSPSVEVMDAAVIMPPPLLPGAMNRGKCVWRESACRVTTRNIAPFAASPRSCGEEHGWPGRGLPVCRRVRDGVGDHRAHFERLHRIGNPETRRQLDRRPA